jgi:hypothetical protein
MLAFIALPLFSLLSLTVADFTCDASTGMTPDQLVESISESSGSGGRTDSCVSLYVNCPVCKSDPTGALCADWYRSQLQGGFDEVVAGKRSLQSRATSLECADGDVCMIVSGLFLCIEPDSLDFEDSNGGKGNLDSDIYTMSNGDVTSVASTATAIPTPTGPGTKATTTGTGSGTKATSTDTGSGTKGTSTATAAGAKATSSGGASGSGNTAQSTSSSAGIFKADIIFSLSLAAVGVAGAFL